jgi:hypothetical protein
MEYIAEMFRFWRVAGDSGIVLFDERERKKKKKKK